MSVKTSIESIIRDKASVVLVVAYILWEQLQQPIEDEVDLMKLLILCTLFAFTLTASYMHTEKTGNYPKIQDLVLELEGYIKREIEKVVRKPESGPAEHITPSI